VGCLVSFPLRRSEDRGRFFASVAEYQVTSHGVGRTVKSYEHQSSRRIGLPASTLNTLFPAARWPSLDAVPRSLASPGSSSYERNLSFRVHPTCHPPDRDCRAPSMGSDSPSRHQREKSTRRRVSHTRLRFAHSVSHAPDELFLHTPCGPISSHCHVRDSHSRGFLRCQAGSPHRRVVPSWR
jgi:hypothetical protein